jgi:hypothetical protein
VPKITDEVPFGGAPEKIARLGLTGLYEGVEHDGAGPALPKQPKRLAGGTLPGAPVP